MLRFAGQTSIWSQRVRVSRAPARLQRRTCCCSMCAWNCRARFP